MNALKKLVNRKYVFHCNPRGQSSGDKDFNVINTPGPPLTTGYIPGWVPPSLKSVYEEWNGLRLFEPEAGSIDGFRLFELDTCAVHLRALREIFADRRQSYAEESTLEPAELDRWLDGLVPIGEIMSSGDVFALDTTNRSDDGECPVYHLDHEYYYSRDCDPESMEIVATNITDFLTDILENPLQFIAADWIGGDIYDQWYPESCTISG